MVALLLLVSSDEEEDVLFFVYLRGRCTVDKAEDFVTVLEIGLFDISFSVTTEQQKISLKKSLSNKKKSPNIANQFNYDTFLRVLYLVILYI